MVGLSGVGLAIAQPHGDLAERSGRRYEVPGIGARPGPAGTGVDVRTLAAPI